MREKKGEKETDIGETHAANNGSACTMYLSLSTLSLLRLCLSYNISPFLSFSRSLSLSLFSLPGISLILLFSLSFVDVYVCAHTCMLLVLSLSCPVPCSCYHPFSLCLVPSLSLFSLHTPEKYSRGSSRSSSSSGSGSSSGGSSSSSSSQPASQPAAAAARYESKTETE